MTDEPGQARTLTFTGESGAEKTLTVQTVSGPGVWQGQHNTEKSIRAFARSCFQYAMNQQAGPVVLHQGHHLQGLRRRASSDIFEEEYETDLQGGV